MKTSKNKRIKQKSVWNLDTNWKNIDNDYNNSVRNLSNDDRDLKNFDVDFDENAEDARY